MTAGLKGWQANGSPISEVPLWSPVVEDRFRLGVCGGRRFDNRNQVEQTLVMLNIGSRVTLVRGGASGADRLAKEAAELLLPSWDFDPFPADWGRRCDADCRHGVRRRRDGSVFCPLAGPERNQKMVDSGLDLVVAFKGGDGTADMVRRSRAAGVPVLRVEP